MFEKISSARDLTSLSQTRRCVRGKAIKTVLECYKEVKDTLTHLVNGKNVRTTSQRLIKGLWKQGQKMKTYVALYACAKVFHSCDLTARIRADITPRESLSAVETLQRKILSLREDIPALIQEASDKATALDLIPPSQQRQRRQLSSVTIACLVLAKTRYAPILTQSGLLWSMDSILCSMSWANDFALTA